MGRAREREQQVFGAALGVMAMAMLALLVAGAISVLAGGHLRPALPPSTGSQGSGASLGVLEQQAPE